MQTIRVLVADDHALFRAGVNALFAATSDIVVVGEAETGGKAIACSRELDPDVVLMNINMPGGVALKPPAPSCSTTPKPAPSW